MGAGIKYKADGSPTLASRGRATMHKRQEERAKAREADPARIAYRAKQDKDRADAEAASAKTKSDLKAKIGQQTADREARRDTRLAARAAQKKELAAKKLQAKPAAPAKPAKPAAPAGGTGAAPAKPAASPMMMGMKRGGGVAKYAKGGVVGKMGSVRTAAPSRDGIAKKGKTKGTMIKMAGSSKGR